MAIDFERAAMLLNITKTIDESFPKLNSLSGAAKKELAEMNDEAKEEREVFARPGMPAHMQEDPAPVRTDDEEVVDARPKPNPTVADARRPATPNRRA